MLLRSLTLCVPAARDEKQLEKEGKRKQEGVAVAFLCSGKVALVLLRLQRPSHGLRRRRRRRRKEERAATRALLRALSRRVGGMALLLCAEVG